MKSNIIRSLAFLFAVVLTGCVNFPVSTQTVHIPPAMKSGDVIEIVIAAARESDFPPATKIDKAGGIVEFGSYGMPELGTTAQVRIKNETEIEVNVRRGSMYVKLPVEQIATNFKAKLETRLAEAAKAGK